MTALSLFLNVSISAQNICSNSSFEQGGFNPNLNEICGIQALNVTNTSTATNIKYVYDYQGETLESALDSASTQVNHTYPLLYQPKMYTIAQIGEKNGKVSVACKNIIVRSNNVPVHSYNICSSQVELVIPLNPSNTFDEYTINLGTSQAPVTISANDLPFSLRKNLAFPSSYSVSGRYNDPTKNCSTSVITRTIPAEVVARALPYAPNINKVELLSLQKVKIDYSGPFTTNPNSSYSLFGYPLGEYTNAKEIIPNLLPGQYLFDIPDTTKTYCFIARSNQACGAIKEESGEICTLPIYSVKRNPFTLSNEINWESYPTTLKGFNVEALGALSSSTYKSEGVLKISNPMKTTQKIPINPSQNQYQHNPPECSDVYTYKIQQTIQGTYRFVKFSGVSISNRISLDPSKIVAPAITKLLVTTDNNRNKIIFEDNIDIWPIEKTQWYLWKESGNIFAKIDSVPLGNTFIIDKQIPSQSESYAVSFRDQCESKSDTSKTIHSIFLTLQTPSKLKWTPSNPFASDNIIQYELISTDNISGVELSKSVESKQIFEKLIDFSIYDREPSFYVKAIGDNYHSISNRIIVPIPSNVFIPNAFSPNNDGINDKLEIKALANTIESFEMKIWNRFGEQVAEIKNLNDAWDGTSNNKINSPGQYAYCIIVQLKNLKINKYCGTILLLK